ncbi:hypothetical protein PV08_11932 [Exophiala spinifera]|uniref:SnoaL-like domain-containing protein n=1 Tax=Exophiala spinifera TaxID=91928 RepID=A0A0D1Y4F5_9EURO|nr:uncharacterized protein PV08_11932 [Exophiala spinifera]KIW09831.1 hypothetical protein PV08_11932 [Exophiala spinifera]
MTTTTLPHSLPNLAAREAVVDALYRAVQGIDTNDHALFKSAITDDATMELPGVASIGGEGIMKMFAGVGPMDTTHAISNVRVNLEQGASTATMTAYAVAQHFKAGEGADATSPNLLAGAIYTLTLVEDGGLWKVKKWVADFKWRQGDPSIMTWQNDL